jgi:diadenosine tetraphosphatase ApaH/serine/threonine PP2A family protein phosphatase
MKLALISDVHGNLQALQSVLEDIGKVEFDRLLFLGDAVGYGANPNEVVRLINTECDACIMGNHDACALGQTQIENFNSYAKQALEFTKSTLDSESLQLISEYGIIGRIDDILFTHATPGRPTEWNYCISIVQAAREFERFDVQACFIGHSHFPMIFSRNGNENVGMLPPSDVNLKPDHKYLINVGSVGQPRDGDPRSCYVHFDTDTRELTYRRVSYDIESAQHAMKERGLPEYLIERLARGK